MEIWKDIPGYKGLYQASNLGRIRSFKLKDVRVLVPHLTNYGYETVALNGTRKTVHRLIALTFLPNPDKLPIVDHINGNRTDNRVDNLRWVDRVTNRHNNVDSRRIAELEAEVAELKQYIAYLEARS